MGKNILAIGMIIKNIDDYIKTLRNLFPEYKFNLNYQGCGWCRIFVLYDGCSLGRINFQPVDDNGNRKLYGFKHYKHDNYEYANEDRFFYQFDIYRYTQKLVDIKPLVEKAKIMKLEKIAEIEANRVKLGPKKRKRIERNWMGKFRELIWKECNYGAVNEKPH